MKTEKRKANVGERILITDRDIREDRYENGDVGEVSGSAGGDAIYAKISDRENILILSEEYEVIVDQPEPSVIERMQKEIAELKTKVAALEGANKPKSFIRQAFDECQGEAEEAVKKFLEEALRTPQQIRDEIVERAKADVAELLAVGKDDGGRLSNESEFSGRWFDADIIVNSGKRTVVALVYELNGFSPAKPYPRYRSNPDSRGITKADPSDCFNSAIGKAIALRRALGLEVPAEYYNAPAPTEVRVGDVVELVSSYDGRRYHGTIAKISAALVWYSNGDWDGYDHVCNNGKIIDDSREGVAE